MTPERKPIEHGVSPDQEISEARESKLTQTVVLEPDQFLLGHTSERKENFIERLNELCGKNYVPEVTKILAEKLKKELEKQSNKDGLSV